MKLHRSELELETIVSRIDRDELDLQPDFQRGEIWDARRRQRLIDTILREWYVPAVHIVQQPSGEEVVLDGQQRLWAIQGFFHDEFAVDGRTEPHNDEIADLHGLKFSKLPDAVRRRVRRFALPVITLREFEPGEPNELFFRLNQSYNLTPPEKRNALHGPARDRVRQLVEKMKATGLLQRDTIGFSNGRLAYDDIVARTCVAIEQDNLNIHINNNVVEDFYRNGDFAEETIARVERAAADLLVQIQQVPSKKVRFNKGSLFTWLVYLDSAPYRSTAVPADLLAHFEKARAEVKAGAMLASTDVRRVTRDCVTLYDDRVSYRVTDVSSVVIRDLMVHLYSCLTFNTQPVGLAADLLPQVLQNSDYPLATAVIDYLHDWGWGTDLRSGRG